MVGQLSPGKSISWATPAGSVSINLVPSTAAVSELEPIGFDAFAGRVYDFIVSWSGKENSFVIKEK